MLQSSVISKMAAFFSFPVNMKNSVPDNITYSIFTQEFVFFLFEDFSEKYN